jgi:hypothetical protein
MRPTLRWVMVSVLLLVLAASWVWWKRPSISPTTPGLKNDVPETALYEPSDKPTTVFLRVLSPSDGGVQVVPAVIRKSKSRLNQMKQAVLAYLKGPREGLRPLSPPGAVLNEIYLTNAGTAAVDLSVPANDAFGFYEEALFASGLSHVLMQNFAEVKRVRLLNDGVESGTLTGHYALGSAESLSGSPSSPGSAPP